MATLLRALTAVSFCALNVLPASAQYPTRPIRLVVPYPPGGGSDIVGRTIAEKLTVRMAQPVVVENKPGAAGNIGAEAVVKSTPDGYTLLLSVIGGPAIRQTYSRHVSFDVRRDFAPISRIGQGTIVLVVSPSLGVNSVNELIAVAKARPGKLDLASQGVGSQLHLSGELFKQKAGIDVVHVPYKGTAQFLPDLMDGRIAMSVDNLAPHLPHIRAGRLRALAVASQRRSSQLPEVPTMAEAGVPGVESSLDYALLAPARTPTEVVAFLNGETNAVLEQADVRDKLSTLGIEVGGSSPDALGTSIRDEVTKWAMVMKNANINPE